MTAPDRGGSDAARSIGVAIGLPEPYNSELQRWRERLGDPNAARIPPHVTLLPPTEVPSGSLPEIEEHLRLVAMAEQDFEIRLRGSATFRPVSPVVFVPLVQGISECEQLEAKVRQGPLHRDINFPYHPHVTVAHDVPRDMQELAYNGLADLSAEFRVGHFTEFEQTPSGAWAIAREYPLTGPTR